MKKNFRIALVPALLIMLVIPADSAGAYTARGSQVLETEISVDGFTISGVNLLEFEDGSSTLQLVMRNTKECKQGNYHNGNFQCTIIVQDSLDAIVFEGMFNSRYNNVTQLSIKSSWNSILNQGPIKVTLGWHKEVPQFPRGNTWRTLGYIFNTIGVGMVTKDMLEGLNCNPLEREYLSSSSEERRSKLWFQMMGDPLDRLGKKLDGVTQPRTLSTVYFGNPIAHNEWWFSRPVSGLYSGGREIEKSGQVQGRSLVIDCSRLQARQVETYGNFRFGIDGIHLWASFSRVGGDYQNEWVTIQNKTYQIRRSGKTVVPKSGPIKNCRSLDGHFYDEDGLCYVPPKSGTYKIKFRQQYIGSGNIIISCKGTMRDVYCSTSRDKSVSFEATGTFSISKDGVVKGPNWWPHFGGRFK